MSRTVRLGMFILGTLLLLGVGIFLIGNREFLFSSTYGLKADFRNVAGLIPGADVRVGGIPEGRVDRIDLPKRPDGSITVVMKLNSATRNVLKKDSVAAIKSEGLLGDKYVEISFGSDPASRLKDGDVIGSAAALDISDLIEKTNRILDSTQDVMQNADQTTEYLKSVSAKIDKGKGTVGALINDRSMYQQANAGVAAFREDMEALQHNFLLRGFFRKHGYVSPDELREHAIARLPETQPYKEFSYDRRRIFRKPDDMKLKNPKALNEAGSFLEQNRFGMVVVTASSGMTGDSEKDRTLTESQCAVVRDYLAQNFPLDDTRIKILGLGKARDAAESDKVAVLVYRTPTR